MKKVAKVLGPEPPKAEKPSDIPKFVNLLRSNSTNFLTEYRPAFLLRNVFSGKGQRFTGVAGSPTLWGTTSLRPEDGRRIYFCHETKVTKILGLKPPKAEQPGDIPKTRKLAALKQYGFLNGIPPGCSPSDRFLRQRPRSYGGCRKHHLMGHNFCQARGWKTDLLLS